MRQTWQTIATKALKIISSGRFLWFIVAVLIIQALWIALSGRYPMAFDEDFHLGVIRLYAHHLSPFWSSQPEAANRFGAVARDASYFYHYLMSFPYRLISLFTADQTIQVLFLRFINIGLFASCLPLYQRLLLKSGASRAIINSCLLVFVLLPIVPLLAAQINYDNLILPLVAITLLLAANISNELGLYKRANTKQLVLLIVICLLASLVKYAFLPVFVVVAVFLVIRLWQTYSSVRKALFNLAFGATLMTRRTQILLLITLLVTSTLAFERYGLNLVHYHTPVPDCSKVLTVEQCSEYGPWIRDYTLATNKDAAPHSPISFSAEWLYGMWLRTFFAVDGPSSYFETRGPLVLPGMIGVVLPVLAIATFCATGRRLFRRYNGQILWLYLGVATTYTAILWFDEYKAYTRTGQPVAINGRYLLPVLLPVILIGAVSLNEFLRGKQALKLSCAAITITALLWGGGAGTYILRSNAGWYWPNGFIKHSNYDLQQWFGPIVPGYDNQIQFLP